MLLGRCSEEPLAPFEPYTEALAQAGVAEALEPARRPMTPARDIDCSTLSTLPSPTSLRVPRYCS